MNRLSRRAVLWLGLIVVVAYILYLDGARYNNIDPDGVDYHLVEVAKPCVITKPCSLNKSTHGLTLDYKYSLSVGNIKAHLHLINPVGINRAVVQVVTGASLKKTPVGVISKEVKGVPVTKKNANLWQSGALSLRHGKEKKLAIIYLFTPTAIFEVRQFIVYD